MFKTLHHLPRISLLYTRFVPRLLPLAGLFCLSVMAVLLSACPGPPATAPEAGKLERNLDIVSGNLTDWARGNGGLYPEILTPELLLDGQREPLVNPYDETEVHPVAFTAGEGRAGNICYIAVHDGYDVKGYILLGFGNTPDSGQDVDGDGKPDGVVAFSTSPGVTMEQAAALISEMK